MHSDGKKIGLRAETKELVRRRFCAAALFLFVVGGGCDTARNTTAPGPNSGSPTSLPHGAYTLSGTVRDEAGAPAQGADVYVGYDLRRPGVGEAETDAQGRYALRRFRSKFCALGFQQPAGDSGDPDFIAIGTNTVG